MDTCSRCETVLTGDTRFCPSCGTPVAGGPEDDLLASSASDPTGLLDRLREATAGEFTIIRELGRGGMGRVFLAHEVALDRRVAMKVLPPQLAENEMVVQRFQREARTSGKLSHPHIVAVYQVSERSGLYFFTMPFVAGPSVRQILRETAQLEADRCRRYLREAADALSYAHSEGVIHRDIKPENMLLHGSRDGRLLLTDFGIAKALGTGTTLTRPGDLMGTPYFMSPEQCEESESIDGRSDQYSLGLVGYEMLAGRFPFAADSLAGLVYKHLHEYPEPLETVRPDIPADLREVIERAIRKDPDERFPTMAHMLEALGGAGTERVVVERPPRLPGRRRRRPGWAAWAAPLTALAVVVLAVAGLALWQAGVLTPPWAEEPELALGGNGQDVAEPAGTVSDDDSDTDPAGSAEGEEPQAAQPAGTSPPVESGAPNEQATSQRREAELARNAAREARRAAAAAGADTVFPSEFGDLERRYRRAATDLEAGRFVAAAAGFGGVEAQFNALARRSDEARQLALAAAGDPGPDTAVGDPDTTVSDPDTAVSDPTEGREGETAETPPVAPAEAIGRLIEEYREALEAEDMDRLSRAVYRGDIPESDRKIFDFWFNQARDLKARIEVQDLQVQGDAAVARVRQAMDYRLQRTGESRSSTLDLRLSLRRTDGAWRLERFEQAR